MTRPLANDALVRCTKPVQSYIAALEDRIKRLEQQITVLTGDAPPSRVSWMVDGEQRALPAHATIRLICGAHAADYVDIALRHDEFGRYVSVMGGDMLTIEPHSSNVVQVRPLRATPIADDAAAPGS